MKPLLPLFGAVLWGLSAPCAFAMGESGALQLEWQAPPECKKAAEIHAEVLQMAGAEGPAREKLIAHVDVQHAEGSDYVLTFTTGAEEGAGRSFHAPTCNAVTDALAVTLALILNPDAEPGRVLKPEVASTKEGKVDEVAAEEDEVPEEAAPEQAKTRPSRDRNFRFGGAALVGVQLGSLPHAGLIFGGEVGFLWSPASLWLSGFYGPPQESFLPSDPSVGAQLRLFGAMALGCADLIQGRLRPSICAGAGIDRVWGSGIGVANEQSGTIYWWSGRAGARLEADMTDNVGARVSALASVPFARPRVFLAGLGEVFQPDPVGVLVHFAVVGYLP